MPQGERPTIVFVHGWGGETTDFTVPSAALTDRANLAAFEYDPHARLTVSAEALRRDLIELPGVVIVVAHSLGTLLMLRLGATSDNGQLACTRVVYLNPLIGGSRYADGIPRLHWMQPLKWFVQRAFCPPSVRDLAPEGEFQQSIFGLGAPTSLFRDRAVAIFTEQLGNEPDIEPTRVPRFFGRTRDELLDRIGTVIREAGTGHDAPLRDPGISLPVLRSFLDPPSASHLVEGRPRDEAQCLAASDAAWNVALREGAEFYE